MSSKNQVRLTVYEFASNVRDFLTQFIFSRMFHYVPPESFWFNNITNAILETHSYMLSSDACIFRLSPSRNCFVAWDKWPDQLHATASLLQSGESNPYLLHECQGYHTIAKPNSLLACSEKFVSKFPEIWFKCTRVSIEIQLISTILLWKIRTFRIINIPLCRFGNSLYAAIWI